MHTPHTLSLWFAVRKCFNCVRNQHSNTLSLFLQCATLAEASGAYATAIVAALLHDVGHILPQEEGDFKVGKEKETCNNKERERVCVHVVVHVTLTLHLPYTVCKPTSCLESQPTDLP